MKPSIAITVLLGVFVVVAGCVGGQAPGTPQSPRDVGGSGSGAETTTPTGPDSNSDTPGDDPRGATPVVDCPAETERYEQIAEKHIAYKTGTATGNVTVLKGGFVTYEILDECYYHAKVRNAATDDIVGVMIAVNGTVVDREVVERRAERTYRKKYGKLGKDLYDRLQGAETNETIAVAVHLTDINRTDAKQAVARRIDPDNTTAFKRALSEEVQHRSENKTRYWADRMRNMTGVSIIETHPTTVTIDVEARPDGIRRIEQLDIVKQITLNEPNMTPTANPIGTGTNRGGDG